LKRIKLEKVRRKNAKMKCPNCNNDFLEIMVVKILGVGMTVNY